MLDKLEDFLDYLETADIKETVTKSFITLILIVGIVGVSILALNSDKVHFSTNELISQEKVINYTDDMVNDIYLESESLYEGYILQDMDITHVTGNKHKSGEEITIIGELIYIVEGNEFSSIEDLDEMNVYEYRIHPVVYRNIFDKKGNLITKEFF